MRTALLVAVNHNRKLYGRSPLAASAADLQREIAYWLYPPNPAPSPHFENPFRARPCRRRLGGGARPAGNACARAADPADNPGKNSGRTAPQPRKSSRFSRGTGEITAASSLFLAVLSRDASQQCRLLISSTKIHPKQKNLISYDCGNFSGVGLNTAFDHARLQIRDPAMLPPREKAPKVMALSERCRSFSDGVLNIVS